MCGFVDAILEPIAMVASFIPGPWTPFAQGFLALNSLAEGNPLGAIFNGIGAFGGLDGLASSFGGFGEMGSDLGGAMGESMSTGLGDSIGDAISGTITDVTGEQAGKRAAGLFGDNWSTAMGGMSGPSTTSFLPKSEGLFGALGNMSGLQVGSSLYDMYQKNKVAGDLRDRYNQQESFLNSMYAPGSPEYNLMKQEMERKDAAAGRNSQYGTRLVDLNAKLAGIKSQARAGMAGTQGQLLSSSSAFKAGGLNSLFANLNKNATTTQPSLLVN
jgi:hypothetical protein